jgi:hypothetical protein
MIRIIIYHNHKSPSNCPNPHLKSHDFSGACFVNSGPSKDEVEHLVGLCAQYPIPQTLVRCAAPGPEEIEKNGLRSSQKMTIHSEIDGGFIWKLCGVKMGIQKDDVLGIWLRERRKEWWTRHGKKTMKTWEKWWHFSVMGDCLPATDQLAGGFLFPHLPGEGC